MAAQKLAAPDIEAALRGLPNWEIVNGKLHREYRFADFEHAFGFMTVSALAIEAMNHHPEWSNVYNRVTVELTTHSAGGVTLKDIELARKLEAIAQKFQ
jgi:4a-hydroxytetrahydrobiopterin dehydratase